MAGKSVAVRRLAPAALFVLLLLAGCGGSGSEDEKPSALALPECAPDDPAVRLSPRFPRAFPFLPGTKITLSGSIRSGPVRFTIAEGIFPGRLQRATAFFLRELPESGFELGAGDSEAHEAETDFSGHGVTGRLKINDIIGCPGAMTIEIAVTRN